MSPVIEWPEFLRVKSLNLWLQGATASPGPGLDGRTQVVFAENRVWIGEVEFNHIASAQARGLRAFGNRLNGRAGVLRLPLPAFEWSSIAQSDAAFFTALGIDAADVTAGSLGYSDAARFAGGAGFALPDRANPTVKEDAAAGSSSIILDGYIGRNLVEGDRFSIDDFLYEVDASEDGALVVHPPLRQSVTAGQTAEVLRPVIRVRLRNDDGFRSRREMERHVAPFAIKVTEAFDR